MVTVRNIEKLWVGKAFSKLFLELIDGRTEAIVAQTELRSELEKPAALAALAMIRLEELSLSHVRLFQQLKHYLIVRQQPDGGWGDPAVTALAIRALSAGRGRGAALDAAYAHLAELQRDDGLWPAVDLRRLPGDATVTAFILFHLGNDARFRITVRTDTAWAALDAASHTDVSTRRLYSHAQTRCRSARPRAVESNMQWS